MGEAVENLCEQERLNREIMRFGLPDGRRKTQRDIAKILGISRSYVSRIEKHAITKLGKTLSGEDIPQK
ncbi:MAG: sigE 1 [Firmicutes bacterium]|nr:sigE 1 [Bacillota bacterium]